MIIQNPLSLKVNEILYVAQTLRFDQSDKAHNERQILFYRVFNLQRFRDNSVLQFPEIQVGQTNHEQDLANNCVGIQVVLDNGLFSAEVSGVRERI